MRSVFTQIQFKIGCTPISCGYEKSVRLSNSIYLTSHESQHGKIKKSKVFNQYADK